MILTLCIEVGVSRRMSCSVVGCLCVGIIVLITSVGEERAIFSFIVYLVSVRRSFCFLLVLVIGCAISLWHSLGLPYNYFVT